LQTADEYSGSYEVRLFKRLGGYVGLPARAKSTRDLFCLSVLNCALRNGNAHAGFAPVYDLVTTTAYLPLDAMALTLNGTTHWPEAR
jgi:serine/threonine-protein kinase HipA